MPFVIDHGESAASEHELHDPDPGQPTQHVVAVCGVEPFAQDHQGQFRSRRHTSRT